MKRLICILTVIASVLLIFNFISCEPMESGDVSKNGKVENVVIYVNFAEGETYPDAQAEERVLELNASPVGMTEFFKAESLGQCEVSSTYVGSITLEQTEKFYKKKNRFTNKDGYNFDTVSGKKHIDSFYREQTLIREAVSKIDFNQEHNFDGDCDGYVDGITFVLNSRLDSDDEDILWPHKSEFYSFTQGVEDNFYIPEDYFGQTIPEEQLEIPEINGAKVKNYAVVGVGFTYGEICHEFSHVLGLPDYYSYVGGTVGSKYDNIGGYDLMGANVGKLPQYSLAYVRTKLGWLNEIEHVKVTDKTSSFTLAPVTENGVQAVKIIPSEFSEKGEYFMVEARRKQEGCFDDEINSTGLIVYSVKEENAFINVYGDYGSDDYGNMYGNGKFEVKLLLNKNAPLPVNYFTSKDKYNKLENAEFSDGNSAGFSIKNIVENADGTFSFDVIFDETEQKEQSSPTLKLIADNHVAMIQWELSFDGVTHVMAIKATGRSAIAFSMGMLPSAKQVVNGDGGGFEVIYHKKVSTASRAFLPRINEECFFVTVSQTQDGRLYAYETMRLGISGEQSVSPSFDDVLYVLFLPGKPAFIACCALLGLCVLVAFLVVVVKTLKRKKRGE